MSVKFKRSNTYVKWPETCPSGIGYILYTPEEIELSPSGLPKLLELNVKAEFSPGTYGIIQNINTESHLLINSDIIQSGSEITIYVHTLGSQLIYYAKDTPITRLILVTNNTPPVVRDSSD